MKIESSPIWPIQDCAYRTVLGGLKQKTEDMKGTEKINYGWTAMDITRMNKNTLREKLHDPNIILIDLRRHPENASAKIPGAVLEDPDRVDQWQENYPKDHQIILYCA